MKLGVIIITYNLPVEIFLLQIAGIKKFCKDDYVIEIFDNSSRLKFSEDIKYHAGQFGIKYTKTFSSSQNGSDSHSFAANFAFQKIKNDYTHFFFMDHDLIPVKEFSVVEILSGGYVMGGIGQGAEKKYLWPGCLMINSNELLDKNVIDFSFSHELHLDTGGLLYKTIEQYGEDRCKFFNESYYQNPYFNHNQYSHYTMIMDETFLHFTNASNWFGADRHEERINTLINIAKEKTGL